MAISGQIPLRAIKTASVRGNASAEILAAQGTTKKIYILAVTLSAEADDLDITLSFSSSPSATNTIFRGKFKDGGGLEKTLTNSPLPSPSANQDIYATLNSGTGYFTVSVQYLVLSV